ncbi:MAG: type II toxin-antitoxin system RelE/ParE family toxin [Cyanobacteria bacterium P01_G01_bin.54]
MADKKIYWLGSSKKDLSDFPKEAKRKAGFQLRALQRGEQPTDFKPMPTVGKGVEEIRIWTGDAYCIFYVARSSEAVYVLHAFQKKAQQTARQDIELGQQRYQSMIQIRQSQN